MVTHASTAKERLATRESKGSSVVSIGRRELSSFSASSTEQGIEGNSPSRTIKAAIFVVCYFVTVLVLTLTHSLALSVHNYSRWRS